MRRGASQDRARLTASLHDADPELRLAALQALRLQAGPEDETPLLALLADRDWWVRQTAADALVELAGPRAPALVDTVADRYGRDALVRALAEREA